MAVSGEQPPGGSGVAGCDLWPCELRMVFIFLNDWSKIKEDYLMAYESLELRFQAPWGCIAAQLCCSFCTALSAFTPRWLSWAAAEPHGPWSWVQGPLEQLRFELGGFTLPRLFSVVGSTLSPVGWNPRIWNLGWGQLPGSYGDFPPCGGWAPHPGLFSGQLYLPPVLSGKVPLPRLRSPEEPLPPRECEGSLLGHWREQQCPCHVGWLIDVPVRYGQFSDFELCSLSESWPDAQASGCVWVSWWFSNLKPQQAGWKWERWRLLWNLWLVFSIYILKTLKYFEQQHLG